MEYNFRDLEAKWQKYWAENKTFKSENKSSKPKCYVLDMFPYPSGAGLHVGHPLGYIASDIFARYKRHKGFNVMHPQGYDSFGLPAEQYAIQTGQHPAITTAQNIKTFRKQLEKIGFSLDWSREVKTSVPSYYKWTQWIFLKLFDSYYCKDEEKAKSIDSLVEIFEKKGNESVNAACNEEIYKFDHIDWGKFSEEKKQEILLNYRLAYLSDTEVNWCAELGTVLANDEVINGLSERGGFPVVRKKMKQWSLRITAYAQKLLDGLKDVDWPQPIKDAQTNWIGRSKGAMIDFEVAVGEGLTNNSGHTISVFTTRPDTIFGVSFMTLAPEHELVKNITTESQKVVVKEYVAQTAKRTEVDRMSDTKTVSGVFTGAYVIHPFTQQKVPVWIGDYVLAGYGTGAVMSVPCGDQRDYSFAKHFGIEIPNIFEGVDISEKAFEEKSDDSKLANSSLLDGMSFQQSFECIVEELEKRTIGCQKINYKLRDAVFSRQRYWGEPFPLYYKDGMPQAIDEKYLPLILPEVENYLPTNDGRPPLGNAKKWAWDIEKNEVVDNDLIDHKTVFPLELNTMPGWAGSSQYFNRYMDSANDNELCSKEAMDYWQDVDLYVGGKEHAVGHLLYSRFWQHFMYDIGFASKKEFAKKLINQGMITGTSAFVYRRIAYQKTASGSGHNYEPLKTHPVFLSSELTNNEDFFESEKFKIDLLQKYPEYQEISDQICFGYSISRAHVSFVNASDELDIQKLKTWKEFKGWISEYSIEQCDFIKNDQGKFKVRREVEKMSKSKYNVVSPDGICEEYGADSLRLFEMFLGPLEHSKPWNTAGITGVHSFLKKLWKLFYQNGAFTVVEESPTKEESKIIHKTIKKIEEDINNFSFNTSVSSFMIAVNELIALNCNKRSVLESLVILIEPFAPHIAEELWSKLGYDSSVSTVDFPTYDEKYLIDDTKIYPVSFNGKMKFKLEFPLEMSKEAIEKAVLNHEKTQKILDGNSPKKVIVVPGKIVNVVV